MKNTVCVYLFLGLLAVAYAGDAWHSVARLVPHEGNYKLSGRYTVQDGLSVRFHSKADGKSASVKLSTTATVLSDWTGSPSKRPDQYMAWPANLPPGDDPSMNIVIKVREAQWWIYLNNRPVLTLQPPVSLPATLELSDRNTLPANRVKFQKITPFSFTAEFMDVEEGVRKLANWEQLGGVWTLHTVMQDAMEQHTSKKLDLRPVVPTHSPNFYSLEGAKKGILLTGYPFEDNYRMRVSIQTGPAESGLVFYYQDARNYYTFGLAQMLPNDEKAWFKLIRYSSDPKLPARATLAVVEVALTSGQWVMPEVRVNNSRLSCYLDNRKVIDVQEHLPVGGRYGLYVAGDDAGDNVARFDDVSVASVTSLPLPNLKAVRFHTIDSENDIYEQESSILQFFNGANRNPMEQQWIESSISGKPRWLAIGDAKHGPHAFGADFNVRSRIFDLGLLIAFKSREASYYRYRCIYDGEMLRTLCEEVNKGKETILVERSTPFSREQLGTRHKLVAVTTPDKLVKLYFNDDLVFVQPIDHADGASGVYLGKSTQARISDLSYRFKPTLEYVNKYEKNPIFVTDPFMKHWSSPEGEWFSDPTTKETWHKSDFFGEYSLTMPWVVGSEIHLSVEEQKKEGQAFLRITPDGRLELIFRGKSVLKVALPEAVMNDSGVEAGKKPAYSLHYGDQAIWITSGKQFLGVYHLKYSLRGSRVRVKGFKREHLAVTLSRRHNVYDALFTQALHDWSVGGGKWQVINRFQCKPTFSHLNGESADGPAYLWSKHTFKGDFCVEFYVGLRHGDWYKKSGRDFNLTIMNDETSPATGYTVTCSGWEPNEMQRLTRLYKNGELVTSSETYTAPQVRSGNKRKLFDPILQRGRDVHGAWYYIKLRRRGSKMEYFFDNERILTWNDPDPIDVGSLGIWTYRNSMMVSRVKVSAESVEPTWFPIRNMTSVPARPTPQKPLASMGLTANGLPVDIMHPSIWKNETMSTHCNTRWNDGGGLNGTSVVQKATFGGGSMHLESHLPMLPLKDVSGIRFSVKRSEGTQFNFYYNLHQSSVKGSLPIKRYMYRLSGNDLETPEWAISGSTDIPPLSVETFNRPGNWTDIVVWFPRHFVNLSSYYVNVLGFGNLDPSYVQQGLEGNKPGARYALGNASLIFNEVPTITSRQTIKGPFSLRGLEEHRYSHAIKTVETVTSTLSREQRPGLNVCEISCDNAKVQLQPVNVYWNRVPTEPKGIVEWHPEIPYAIKITNPTHAPLLATATVSASKERMNLIEETAGEFIGLIPIAAIDDQPQATLEYRLKDSPHTAILDYMAAPTALYPVLKELSGPAAILVDGDTVGQKSLGRESVKYCPSERRYLMFQNQKYGARLIAPFNQRVNLSRFPIMAFRYNCDPSSQVSINLGVGKVAFTESFDSTAQRVRYAGARKLGDWQSWLGVISDIEFQQSFSKSPFLLNKLQFGSTSIIDQTGKFSRLNIDNLVVGPVVNKADDLSFAPMFVCPGGVKLVEYTVISGGNSLHGLSDNMEKSLIWKEIPNGKLFTPDLTALQHAVGRLVIRAASSKGILSQPFEIPFMIDKIAPRGSHAFVKENYPGSNGTFLNVTFQTQSKSTDDAGAPVDLSKLIISADGESLDVPASAIRVKHNAMSDTLLIDWPYLLRNTLTPERKEVALTLTGIVDGAGNTADDVSVIVGQPEKDTARPTWISMNTDRAPSINQAFVFPWTNPKAAQPTVQGSRATTAKYIHQFEKTPFIRLRGYKTVIYGWFQVAPGKWNLDTHPYLSLAIRLPKGGGTGRFYVEVQGQGDVSVKFPMEFNASEGKQISKDWHYFTFDIRNRFRKLAKRRDLGKDFDPKIWHVAVRGVKTVNNLEVDVRDVLIHAPWTETDVVQLDSYDASAILRYEYQLVRGEDIVQEGELSSATVQPHGLSVTAENGDWLRLYSVDAKGNRSYALRLPIAK